MSTRSEVQRLRQWKREALIVLRDWLAVWDAAGRPGELGESLAKATAAEVRRLRAENERLKDWRQR